MQPETYTSPAKPEWTTPPSLDAPGEYVELRVGGGSTRIQLPPGMTLEDVRAGRVKVECYAGSSQSPTVNIAIYFEECDQTDLGASDDRPLGPDSPIYRQG